jgi:hypothetical protein
VKHPKTKRAAVVRKVIGLVDPEKVDGAYKSYASILAEPELLEKALLLDVRADEVPLAIPVGKSRCGGMLEFSDKREANKAVRLLAKRRGFPNPRVIERRTDAVYWQVRWGIPPPFDGMGQEVSCNILLGVHYGYSDMAITIFAAKRLKSEGRNWTPEKIFSFVQSARYPQ